MDLANSVNNYTERPEIPSSLKVPTDKPLKLQTSKTANKVGVVKTLIEKYRKESVQELLKKIVESGNTEDLSTFRTLHLGPTFQTIFLQALSEIDIERKCRGDTMVDKLLQTCPIIQDSYSTVETASLFMEWCKEQKVEPGDLLHKMFLVCDKSLPKLNCLMLQGASNAGKTYWTNMICSIPDIVGQTIQSADFAYMHCVDKELIQIPELTLTKPENVEEFKKIIEGLPTLVNIKNKEARTIVRTPVILTCNNLPWRQFSNEAGPIKYRMFHIDHLHSSTVLENVQHPADPRFLVKVFSYIRQTLCTKEEFPVDPSNDYYPLYTDMIREYVKEIIHSGSITLKDMINEQYLDNDVYSDHKHTMCTNVPQGFSQHTDIHILQWMKSMTHSDSDYYWDFTNYLHPVLYSGLTKQVYNPRNDIDESDYSDFKNGYVHIERLLIKIKHYPNQIHYSQSGQSVYCR